MTAPQLFIIGYVVFWQAWSRIVRNVCSRHDGREASLGLAKCAAILISALVPFVALSLTAFYTHRIPPPVNEMLSLMTPALFALFVLEQLIGLRVFDRRPFGSTLE